MSTQQKITVEYNSSVLVPAGWRSVTITAEAVKISEKRCEITKMLKIDNEEPNGYTSRTGARRQWYNADGIAAREIGKVKIISKLRVLNG